MSLPEEKSPASPIFNAVLIQGCIPCTSCYVTSLIYFKPVTVKLESTKTAYIHTCKSPPSPSLTNQSDKIGIEDDCLYKHTHTNHHCIPPPPHPPTDKLHNDAYTISKVNVSLLLKQKPAHLNVLGLHCCCKRGPNPLE